MVRLIATDKKLHDCIPAGLRTYGVVPHRRQYLQHLNLCSLCKTVKKTPDVPQNNAARETLLQINLEILVYSKT